MSDSQQQQVDKKRRLVLQQRGVNLLRLFNLPEWESVIEIEQELLNDCEKRMVKVADQRESHEQYLTRMMTLSGRRDAILGIYKARHMAMEATKRNEETEEHG